MKTPTQTNTGTLKGARAERIEYLLLHEFHRLGYVVPDKQRLKKKSKPGRSKAAYSGGLVLEPKKGLYDSYVLLLDFNSLYPSIIREYNICFTTVDRDELNRARIEAEENDNEEAAKAADELPELPPKPAKGEKFAPLPSVIHHLVERRYVVKGMLKKEKNTAKRIMLDIRQKALKILANSMYVVFERENFSVMSLISTHTSSSEVLEHYLTRITPSLNSFAAIPLEN